MLSWRRCKNDEHAPLWLVVMLDAITPMEYSAAAPRY